MTIRPDAPQDFWSRRKAAVAAERVADENAVAQEEKAVEAAALEERSDEDILAELNLPDPDQTDSSEDVRQLLRAELPNRLRTRALRRLWRLNPVLANVDGLLEYGEDYTDAATVVENLQTVYQVGKGMVQKLDEALDQLASDEPVQDPVEPDPQEDPIALMEQPQAEPMPAPFPVDMAEDDPAPTLHPPARRMRFRFDPSAAQETSV